VYRRTSRKETKHTQKEKKKPYARFDRPKRTKRPRYASTGWQRATCAPLTSTLFAATECHALPYRRAAHRRASSQPNPTIRMPLPLPCYHAARAFLIDVSRYGGSGWSARLSGHGRGRGGGRGGTGTEARSVQESSRPEPPPEPSRRQSRER